MAWTKEERLELIKGRVFRMGATDIVVEVISAGNSKKKLRNKFEVYQENGVKEYWIIFPGERIVTVHTLSDAGVYSVPEYFTEEDTLTTSLLPVLKLRS